MEKNLQYRIKNTEFRRKVYLNIIQNYYTKAQKYVLGMKECLKHFP